MPDLQLVGGEQDGHTVKVATSNMPEVFYAVPLADVEKIRSAHGNLNRLILRDKLARLAYRFDKIISIDGHVELRYVRAPEKDKEQVSSL
jgi:hypothetical protein